MARINLSNKMRRLLIGLGAAFFMLVGLIAPAAPAMADSSDYTAWIDQGIIYTAPVSDTNPGGNAYYPSVIYDNNHFGSGSSSPTYKMWYSISEGITFLVTSSDGWHWSAPTTMTGLGPLANHVRVLYDANGFGSGDTGPKYKMWYWNNSYDDDITPISTAQSVDGVNWTGASPISQDLSAKLVTGTGWNTGTYGPVYLFYNQSATNSGTKPWDYSYVMYYEATNGADGETGLAYSANGAYWKAYSSSPVLANTPGAWDSNSSDFGTVYRDSQGFHFWYSGGTSGPNDGIGYASSADGEIWVKNPTPIFHVNDGVSYRNERTNTPAVIDDGTGVLKMYYTAQATGGPKKIGLATAGTQSWLLDSKTTLPSGKSQWNLDLITTPQGGSASHTNPFVMTQNSRIWIAGQPAGTNVVFSSGTWTVTLVTNDWSSTCSAEVGDYNPGTGNFTVFHPTASTTEYIGGTITITITTGAGTVSTNHYLALKITNGSGDSQTINLGGSSYLVSPSSTPDYPLPELTAGILLALGLAGLGGFLVIRRKKAEKASRA